MNLHLQINFYYAHLEDTQGKYLTTHGENVCGIRLVLQPNKMQTLFVYL